MKKGIVISVSVAIVFIAITALIVILCLNAKSDKNGNSDYINRELGDESMETVGQSLSKDDYELIDYINANSDYGFTLMEFLGNVETSYDNPYSDITPDGGVASYGFNVSGLEGVYRTQVVLKREADYNILGVKYGDLYDDAIEKLQNAGFTDYEDEPFGAYYQYTTFAKNNVHISFRTPTKKNLKPEDKKITDVCVSVYLPDDKDSSSGEEY